MPEEQLGGLDVAIDAITVGIRHRKDLGDLDALSASIKQLGLLQPITITPGRALVCGWRRLEAVKRLGWTQVRVWIRSGLSDNALQLLAEHDENVLRQAYTKLEQAKLYQEFKDVLREDARRRQEASRFSSAPAAETDETDDSTIVGAVDSTGPAKPGTAGDLRDQAALLASGKKSWQAYERIGHLMDYAVDPNLPANVRDAAAEAVMRIENGGQVAPEWENIQRMLRTDRAEGSVEGSEEESAADVATGPRDEPVPEPAAQAPKVTQYALRIWATTWERISRLLDEHDPKVLGPALPPRDWETLCDVQQRLTGMVATMDAARNGTPKSCDDSEASDTASGDSRRDEDENVGSEAGSVPADPGSADLTEPMPLGARP